MMNCEAVIEKFLEHYRSRIRCLPGESERLCLVLPHFYPDHDNIELFVRDKGEYVSVSDLGETLRKLAGQGAKLDADSTLLKRIVEIAKSMGVELTRGILNAKGAHDELGRLMLSVLSVCQSIGSLHRFSKEDARPDFKETLRVNLQQSGFQVVPNFEVGGESGKRHLVDLGVRNAEAAHAPGDERARLIKTISVPWGRSVKRLVDAAVRLWSDVPEPRLRFTVVDDSGGHADLARHDMRQLERWSQVYRMSEEEKFKKALRETIKV
jgi:hypothetical protein